MFGITFATALGEHEHLNGTAAGTAGLHDSSLRGTSVS
jgi:hypothetical protein